MNNLKSWGVEILPEISNQYLISRIQYIHNNIDTEVVLKVVASKGKYEPRDVEVVKILAVVGDTHSMNEALLFSAELDDIPVLQGCHKFNHLMNVKTKINTRTNYYFNKDTSECECNEHSASRTK